MSAVAARHAQAALGIERVAIVDWDVHHGNGTEAIFRDDDSVLFVSLHQWPFYPGTGGPDTSDAGTLNIPLAAGAGDRDYAGAFRELVEPAVALVRSRARDRLGRLRCSCRRSAGAACSVTAKGFRDLAARCAQLAPHVAAVLEGGYNLATLPALVEAALEGFQPAET